MPNSQAKTTASSKTKPKGLHPRNIHNHSYDFPSLISTLPALAEYTTDNGHGSISIDFANSNAVKTLNHALLLHHYDIHNWHLPDGALCPPVPGRADYIHYVADLLNISSSSPSQQHAKPRAIKMLDIGTGANGIYSLLASRIYGWQCVGSDINADSLANLSTILSHNSKLEECIELRLQGDKNKFFDGIIKTSEHFDIAVCNPPFHASLDDALKGTRRKLNNLNKKDSATRTKVRKKPEQNFGGEGAELWCNGGEKLFLKKMIKESKTFADQCQWFTSLVSKSENLTPSIKLIQKLGAQQHKTIEMAQGNKITRILAWRF